MTIANIITNLTFEYDKFDYESRDFRPDDVMYYVRKTLMEKVMDGLYFNRYGKDGKYDTEKLSANAKREYEAARKLFDGTEISQNKIRGAHEKFKASQHKHEQLVEMYDDMQAAWFAEFGEYYTPYNAAPDYNYGTQNVPQEELEIPQWLKDMDAEMGIEVESANDLVEPKKRKKA